MSLEVTAQSLESALIEPLSFKLKNSAEYVTRRESVTIYPSGGNSYSNQGVRVIRIPIVSDGWLDPSTVSLSYKITNLDSVADTSSNQTRLQLLGGQHAPFGRLRVLMGGNQVEDIQSYNRFYQQMLMLAPESYVKNYVVQGPGTQDATPSVREDYFQMRTLGPGKSKTMTMPLLCGTFNQPKWLPCRWISLILEIELSDPSNCCRGHQSGSAGAPPIINYTSNLQISDVQIKCDMCYLDNSLEEEFSKVLLSGRKMPLNLICYTHTMHSLVPGDDAPTITTNRAVSRLKTAFLSFFAQAPTTKDQSEMTMFAHPIGRTDYTTATHPGTVANLECVDDSQSLTYQWILNADTFPTFPVRSFGEAWTQLTKALGQHNSVSHPVGIDYLDYHSSGFMVAQDFEAVLQAGFSGKSLRNNSNLSVALSNMTLGGTLTSSSTNAIRRAYMLLMYDLIVNISDAGIEVLD